MRGLAYGLLGLAAALGCSSTPLQSDGGVIPGNDGGSVDRFATSEGPPPRQGTRSFVVTSTLMPHPDAGMMSLPAGHRFTLVLDLDLGSAIVGSDGAGQHASAAVYSTSVLIAQPLSFALGNASGVTYERIDLTFDPAGTLSGTARGRVHYVPPNTDFGDLPTTAVTASLAGIPDTEPPTLKANLTGTDVDPFNGLTVTASEPLPIGTRVVLVDGRGDRVTLDPTTVETGAAFSFLLTPYRMWRYGERYEVLTDNVRDFAGNASAAGALTFTIAPPPPLVPADGFESATGPTFAGAQILSGAGAPTIAGARSLYVPPLPEASPPGRGDLTQLTARVALTGTETTLRFSYRTVNPTPNPTGSVREPYFLLGSEGGQVSRPTLGADSAPPSAATIPGEDDVMLGPLMTAAIPLPPGAAGAVTLVRKVYACCGALPASPVPGLIIDDLRAE